MMAQGGLTGDSQGFAHLADVPLPIAEQQEDLDPRRVRGLPKQIGRLTQEVAAVAPGRPGPTAPARRGSLAIL